MALFPLAAAGDELRAPWRLTVTTPVAHVSTVSSDSDYRDDHLHPYAFGLGLRIEQWGGPRRWIGEIAMQRLSPSGESSHALHGRLGVGSPIVLHASASREWHLIPRMGLLFQRYDGRSEDRMVGPWLGVSAEVLMWMSRDLGLSLGVDARAAYWWFVYETDPSSEGTIFAAELLVGVTWGE
jgi:hypothetical protein